jgi:hypothetical protein
MIKEIIKVIFYCLIALALTALFHYVAIKITT